MSLKKTTGQEVSTEELPEIPKEWNITKEQREKMTKQQKRVISNNNKRKKIQEINNQLFIQNASTNPSKYPIIVVIKQKKGNIDDFFLTNNHEYIFAESYDDAIFYVKQNIDNAKSDINQLFLNTKPHGDTKLRLSSLNKKNAPKINGFSLIKNSNFKYWSIIVTNVKQGVVSKFKQFFSKKLVKGGRKNNTFKKTKRSK
jgi:hypothetical protein